MSETPPESQPSPIPLWRRPWFPIAVALAALLAAIAIRHDLLREQLIQNVKTGAMTEGRPGLRMLGLGLAGVVAYLLAPVFGLLSPRDPEEASKIVRFLSFLFVIAMAVSILST